MNRRDLLKHTLAAGGLAAMSAAGCQREEPVGAMPDAKWTAGKNVINIYAGGVGHSVAFRHLTWMEGARAQVVREHHLPAWRAGGLEAQVFIVGDFSSINTILSEIDRSEGELVFCRNRKDFETRPKGSFGLFVTLKGHASMAGNLDALRTLAEIGVASFTFSHNAQNLLCTGSAERYEGGFTHLGIATLKELERLPILVDLVHMSRPSFWDAAKHFDGLLFVSHSNAAAVFEHPRNITDDQIKAVAERGGVVGLNSYRGYVTAEPLKSTIDDFVDHALHMCELVGPEHVAIGADYAEIDTKYLRNTLNRVDPGGVHGVGADIGVQVYAQGPKGMEDASKFSNNGAALARRGLDEAVTFSFLSGRLAALFGGVAENLRLVNPISADLDVMRPSLLPNLAAAARRNLDRGVADLGMFEIGPQYADPTPEGQALIAAGLRRGNAARRHWAAPARGVDAYDAKGDALAALTACAAPLDKLKVAAEAPAWYHPGRSGTLRLGAAALATFGELHPRVLRGLDLRGPCAAFEVFLERIPLPKAKAGGAKPALELAAFQAVERDFAFLVDSDTPAEALLRAARSADKALIAKIEIFDVYQGKGVARDRKSMAIAVTLQPRKQTLTEAEIEAVSAKIVAQVEKATGGVLRG